MLKIFELFSFIRAQKQANICIWNSLASIVSQMIVDLDIKEITTESLCNCFADYYRYRIPMHPMNELIGKMMNANYIYRDETVLKVNFKKVREETPIIQESLGYFDGLIYRISRYLKDRFKYESTEMEIQEALIRYLDEYHTDILSGLSFDHVFVVKDCDSDMSFMLNRFISEELITLDEQTNFIDLIIANINLSAIFFSTSNKIRNRNRCTVYLDTRVILRLIGIEGDFRKREYELLFDVFVKNEFSLKMFQVHYEELLGILNDCIFWLDHKDRYNSLYASPALRHFVENNYDSSQVIVFKKKVEKAFEHYKIRVDDYSYDDHKEIVYMIDEKKLYDTIVKEYEIEKESFEEYSKSNIIWNDVKAISFIYRRRRGVRPHSLSSLNYVFITVNTSLARAVRKYSNADMGVFYEFHECMTDSYFATYLWLNSTSENIGLLRSKLLASSQNYIKVNPKLKAKYIALVYAKKEAKEIDEDEFQFLKESEIAVEIAMDKTFNNSSNISDRLPEEIIYAYKEKVRAEIKNEYEKRELTLKEIAEKAESERDRSIKEVFSKDDKIQNVINIVEKSARRVSRIICFFISFVFFVPSGVLAFSDIITSTPIKISASIVSFIFGLISTYYGVSIKGLSRLLFEYISRSKKKKYKLLQ